MVNAPSSGPSVEKMNLPQQQQRPFAAPHLPPPRSNSPPSVIDSTTPFPLSFRVVPRQTADDRRRTRGLGAGRGSGTRNGRTAGTGALEAALGGSSSSELLSQQRRLQFRDADDLAHFIRLQRENERRALDMTRKGLEWVEKLCEGAVSKELLKQSAKEMLPVTYSDLLEERQTNSFCGYPCCGNEPREKIPEKGGRSLRIDWKKKTVVNRKSGDRYCSDRCHQQSKWFEKVILGGRGEDSGEEHGRRQQGSENLDGGGGRWESNDDGNEGQNGWARGGFENFGLDSNEILLLDEVEGKLAILSDECDSIAGSFDTSTLAISSNPSSNMSRDELSPSDPAAHLDSLFTSFTIRERPKTASSSSRTSMVSQPLNSPDAPMAVESSLTRSRSSNKNPSTNPLRPNQSKVSPNNNSKSFHPTTNSRTSSSLSLSGGAVRPSPNPPGRHGPSPLSRSSSRPSTSSSNRVRFSDTPQLRRNITAQRTDDRSDVAATSSQTAPISIMVGVDKSPFVDPMSNGERNEKYDDEVEFGSGRNIGQGEERKDFSEVEDDDSGDDEEKAWEAMSMAQQEQEEDERK